MGFPGDEDPTPEEFECPECKNILTTLKVGVVCEECGFSWEPDPPEKDYTDYDGPMPCDRL